MERKSAPELQVVPNKTQCLNDYFTDINFNEIVSESTKDCFALNNVTKMVLKSVMEIATST